MDRSCNGRRWPLEKEREREITCSNRSGIHYRAEGHHNRMWAIGDGMSECERDAS